MVKNKPPVWAMIKEAIEALGGKAQYSQIREYIHAHYENVNDNTISAQITVCTVNNPSRIHFPENAKPRKAMKQYDFLFRIGHGLVELYDPEKHGEWEIFKDENGKLGVRKIPPNEKQTEEQAFAFAFESHLRDFLAQNLGSLPFKNAPLSLYVDEDGNSGVEYRAGRIGVIDILALDRNNDFVVFELKISKGSDKTIGQILRYMGWVQVNLAEDKKVRGIIVADEFDEKIRYAVKRVPDIELWEYTISFKLEKLKD